MQKEICHFDQRELNCKLDQGACNPMNSVSNKLSGYFSNNPDSLSHILQEYSTDLPCSYCFKVVDDFVNNLTNVRLGKHERRILLTAPTPEAEPEIIEPPEGGIRVNESHLKAIRKLSRVGLLWKKRKKQRRLAVCLSPLGQAIVKQLNKELKKRSPIRWIKFRDDIAKTAALSNEDLLYKFEGRIRYDHVLEQLDCREGKNASIVQAIPDMMFRFNIDGKFLDYKPGKIWESLLPPEEFLGKNLKDVMPQDIADNSIKSIKQAIKTGKPQIFEYGLEIKGEFHNYEASIFASSKVEAISLVRDITDKKQSQEILKQSHESFMAILDNMEAIVYVADINTYEILYINQFSRGYFGDAVGKKCWEAFQTKQTGPCSFCTNDKLLDKHGKPSGSYSWQFKNTVNDKVYDIKDRAIKWIDGRIVRLEIAVEAINSNGNGKNKKLVKAK